MHPLLSFFWLLPLAWTLKDDSSLEYTPRRSVAFHKDNANLFHQGGVANYTTMLLREDLDVLLVGAREAIYALDLKDISKNRASVKWEVTQQQISECQNKGKHPESYADGQLTLERKVEDGKGKCPFDPFQRHTSLMLENNLYSATSMNFLGTEAVLMRSSPVTIRTEFKSSWLNEPTFVSMTQIPESQMSAVGDDDKVYLFFSEVAVECDCHNKLLVSRVARVCKGDIGGERTLQKKWTSFLKARMDCPVLESQRPYVIQDVYHWCGSHRGWRDCLFYAVFRPQSETSDLSAVCAYRVSDVSNVFAEGKYKTPVTVETSFVKWVMYSGDVPIPRPGACIDNEARNNGINDTLHLPDPTLQFIKLRPLMDQTIQPVGGKPLLVHKGAAFTRIVVNQVQAADGEKYHVMFMGTEEGTLVKGVNYDGEMFLIEEVQVFQPRVSIKILKFSNVTGQLYAGSDSGVTQVPLATCGRSTSCMDCVLSRDPYCGWDMVDGKCSLLSSSTRELIQSVKEGDAKLCPPADPLIPLKRTIWPGGNLKLYCHSPSQLAETVWVKDGHTLTPNGHFQIHEYGLLIFTGSKSDAGPYRCLSVEKSKAGQFSTTMAEYHVGLLGSGDWIQVNNTAVAGLQAAVGVLIVGLLGLLTWNCYKRHIPLPWNCRTASSITIWNYNYH
ncbi:semaphorin-4E-like isoform X2 [Takifugu rubripes]|uniref:semaphorin-4E-like isoform X2 n=1 Tax=Takifugu rubripes TaxID=31033 RepID=UPI001145A8B1|nr:semaphorin-4E-like isoform X2 [Takifugu rubripes]